VSHSSRWAMGLAYRLPVLVRIGRSFRPSQPCPEPLKNVHHSAKVWHCIERQSKSCRVPTATSRGSSSSAGVIADRGPIFAPSRFDRPPRRTSGSARKYASASASRATDSIAGKVDYGQAADATQTVERQ
jgi:hypothetical protein